MNREGLQEAQDLVREFHRAFKVLIQDRPHIPSEEVVKLRASLIEEECREFSEAADGFSITGMADALADITYVVLGSAVSLGIDLWPIFQEVHRSNMSKVWPDGTVHYREDGKVLKPETYSPAEIGMKIYEQRNSEAPSLQHQMNYVQEVKPLPEPSCGVCGAILTPNGWICKSCGLVIAQEVK